MNTRYAFLAACMAHVEGYYDTKNLAFRNSNPGNIEAPGGVKLEYATKLAGFAALVIDITANAGKQLSVFIGKYAPPNENNTSAYLEEVCTLSGMRPDEIL
jgi:hypothetical protein